MLQILTVYLRLMLANYDDKKFPKCFVYLTFGESYLVRPMRVELIWIAPPPPQDGASTNFATAANLVLLRENSQIRVRYFIAESVEIARLEPQVASYLFDLRQQIAIVRRSPTRQKLGQCFV